MNDLISRQAAIDALKDLPTWWADAGGYYGGAQPPMEALLEPEDAISAIENLPPAQPERKRGKWIKHKDRSCWYCSECTTDDYYAYTWDCDTGEYVFQDNYCPNCGARMRGEEV